jgi:hypothetical protein
LEFVIAIPVGSYTPALALRRTKLRLLHESGDFNRDGSERLALFVGDVTLQSTDPRFKCPVQGTVRSYLTVLSEYRRREGQNNHQPQKGSFSEGHLSVLGSKLIFPRRISGTSAMDTGAIVCDENDGKTLRNQANKLSVGVDWQADRDASPFFMARRRPNP